MGSLAVAGYFFMKLLEEEVGILVTITWIALGTINVTVAGWIVFGEKLSWFQAVAIATIVTGLILIEVCGRKKELALATAKEKKVEEIDSQINPKK